MKIIIVMKEQQITTIPISKQFHDWLKSQGRKGESYEDVIKRLLKPELLQDFEGSKGTSEETSSEEA